MTTTTPVCLLAAVVLLCVATSAVADPRVKWEDVPNYTYARYVAAFRRGELKEGTDEYNMRRALFEERVSGIMRHNADTTKTWKRTINRFTDQTEEERAYVRGGGLYHGPRHPLRQDHTPLVHPAEGLPESVDWRTKGVVTGIKDQGYCGSCWAHAGTETVESFVAIASGQLPVLSQQQVASCTKDPNECGGTGGCEGATNELGMQSIAELGGIAEEWTYPYLSYWGQDFKCRFNDTSKPGGTPRVATVTGYVKLVNDQAGVMEAVAMLGPLAITVDAATWHDYDSGVYDGCTNQTTLDHGVQLVGYGTDPVHGPYWTVRNSWGTAFGEDGYIRLRRHTGTAPCGIDTDPSGGVGCKHGPKTTTVCGACGILADVSYPTGARADGQPS